MNTIEQPSVRRKSFAFRTSLTWAEQRRGQLNAEGKPSLCVGSPPEFKGQEGVWTPEHLFVASVEMCHMLTFLAFAERGKVPLISYHSTASGTLEFIDGHYRFTRIVIAPVIVVEKSDGRIGVEAILREAHHHCLVANSITSVVEVNPIIRTK